MAVSQGKVSASTTRSVYKKESMVRGHHIYKKSWTSMIGEVLPVEREEDNQHDDYAVAVMKNEDIAGHVPRSINDPALIRDPAFISELRTFTTGL